MINPQRLELPMSRTNLHDPKDVRVIEVRLYVDGRDIFFAIFLNLICCYLFTELTAKALFLFIPKK